MNNQSTNHSLSCPAKAGHPVTTALSIGAAANGLRWLLGRPLSRAMTPTKRLFPGMS
jgi:hypothetical protein